MKFHKRRAIRTGGHLAALQDEPLMAEPSGTAPAVIARLAGRFNPMLYRDFILILMTSVILIILIALAPWLGSLGPLRVFLGLVFIMVAPGYCLAAAMFPQASDLDYVERIGLSLGLSVAWVPILALILDNTSWGLRLWPITIGESLSIAVFMGVALWRRSGGAEAHTYGIAPAWRPRIWWRSLPASDKWIQVMIGGALLLTGLAVLWVLVTPSSSEITTEFYMLSQNGTAEDFPREALVGDPLMLTVGVTNRERVARSYRVEVWIDDVWTAGRRQLVGEAGPFFLEVGQNIEWPVNWTMPWPGQDQKVEFVLFAGDDSTPYRRVYFFLNVSEEAG